MYSIIPAFTGQHDCPGFKNPAVKECLQRILLDDLWWFDRVLCFLGCVCDKPIFYSSSGGGDQVDCRESCNNESQDSLLKRFRKKVVRSGVLSTVRRKRWFVSKSEQRRVEKKKAIRRIKRRSYKYDE